MSKQLVNDFLTAIGILTDDAIAKSGAMVMTEAVIKEEKTENNQYYLITVSGEDKFAIGEDGYKQGDVVYISNTNIAGQYPVIQGLVAEYKANVKAYQTDADTYDVNSDILNTRISSAISTGNLAGDEEITLYDGNPENSNNTINIYEADLLRNLAESSALKIKATFDYHCMTNDKLDYGLEFIFDNKVFKISIDDVVGNPFDSGEYGQEVVKIFALQKDEVISDLQQIKLYIKNKNDGDNFQLKDLAIYGAKLADSQEGYSVHIEGDSSIFNADKNTLIFHSYMRKDGIKILESALDEFDLDYQWYISNGDIWRALGAEREFVLKREDVYLPQMTLKCVILQKNSQTGEILARGEGIKYIQNLDPNSRFAFESKIERVENKGPHFRKIMIEQIEGSDNKKFLFYWFKLLTNGNWESLDNSSQTLEIDASLITSGFDTYRCDIYWHKEDSGEKCFINTLEENVYLIPRPAKDRIVIVGAESYLYDGGGNLRSSNIKPLEVYFYDEEHELIDADKYTVEWSILNAGKTALLVDRDPPYDGNSFSFGLQSPINRTQTSNTVQVQVQYQGESFYSTADIGIVFSGDPGSNGSKYICSIQASVPEGSSNRYSTYETYPKFIQLLQGESINLTAQLDSIENANSAIKAGTSFEWFIDNVYQGGINTQTLSYTMSEKPVIVKVKIKTPNDEVHYGYLNIALISSADFLLNPNSGYCQVVYSSSQKLQGDFYSYKPFTFIGEDLSNLRVILLKDLSDSGESRDIADGKESISPAENFASIQYYYYRFSSNKGEITLPILYHINTWEYAAINQWDGQSIALDEGHSTILAPMAGFGSKDGDNKFTGVVMGSVTKTTEEFSLEQGLFAYNQGERTFALNAEDGSASFGKEGKGQIILTPHEDQALITGGNYKKATATYYIGDKITVDKYQELSDDVKACFKQEDEYYICIQSYSNGSGMQINLSAPKIDFGSGSFSIDSEGRMIANQGKIGGWEISQQGLKNKDGDFYINPEDSDTAPSFTIQQNGESVTEKILLGSTTLQDQPKKVLKNYSLKSTKQAGQKEEGPLKGKNISVQSVEGRVANFAREIQQKLDSRFRTTSNEFIDTNYQYDAFLQKNGRVCSFYWGDNGITTDFNDLYDPAKILFGDEIYYIQLGKTKDTTLGIILWVNNWAGSLSTEDIQISYWDGTQLYGETNFFHIKFIQWGKPVPEPQLQTGVINARTPLMQRYLGTDRNGTVRIYYRISLGFLNGYPYENFSSVAGYNYNCPIIELCKRASQKTYTFNGVPLYTKNQDIDGATTTLRIPPKPFESSIQNVIPEALIDKNAITQQEQIQSRTVFDLSCFKYEFPQNDDRFLNYSSYITHTVFPQAVDFSKNLDLNLDYMNNKKGIKYSGTLDEIKVKCLLKYSILPPWNEFDDKTGSQEGVACAKTRMDIMKNFMQQIFKIMYQSPEYLPINKIDNGYCITRFLSPCKILLKQTEGLISISKDAKENITWPINLLFSEASIGDIELPILVENSNIESESFDLILEWNYMDHSAGNRWPKFAVTQKGTLYATEARLMGDIIAKTLEFEIPQKDIFEDGVYSFTLFPFTFANIKYNLCFDAKIFIEGNNKYFEIDENTKKLPINFYITKEENEGQT